jgi:hypothetical protein
LRDHTGVGIGGVVSPGCMSHLVRLAASPPFRRYDVICNRRPAQPLWPPVPVIELARRVAVVGADATGKTMPAVG